MLRKKSSIKPNLKPSPIVAPNTPKPATPVATAPPSSTQPIRATTTTLIRPLVQDADPAVGAQTGSPGLEASSAAAIDQISSCPTAQDTSHKESPKGPTSMIDDRLVQDAITQLTSQKLEPIKSLKLHNKNVKLRDLLFVNPPMTKDQKRYRKQTKPREEKQNKQDNISVSGDDPQPSDQSSSQEEQNNLIPKVKVGLDGKIVLDEGSTIIKRKNLIEEQEAIVEDNEDIISKTNYDSFRRRPTRSSQTKWSTEDTKKFYQALTILGTDFSMMESLLFTGSRSRTELHKKFKREERINKKKVDIALSNRISLNCQELDDLKEVFNAS